MAAMSAVPPSPLVSVLLPAFNHAAYVRAAVESVLGQTYGNLELIAIDDASTDDTWTILQSFRDPRMRIARHATNQGAHATLNDALALAEGRFIAILNSDDVYHPERLRVLVAQAEATGSADFFAFTDVAIIDQADRFVPEDERARAYWRLIRKCAKSPADSWFLTGNPALSTSNFFFSRSLSDKVGGFASLRYTHDWDWALRAAAICAPVWIRKQCLRYRVHPASTLGEGDTWRHIHENSHVQARALLAQPQQPPQDVIAALLGNESLHPLSLLCFLILALGDVDDAARLALAHGEDDDWILRRLAQAGHCPDEAFRSLPHLLEKDRVIAAQAALIEARWRAMQHMDREIAVRDGAIAERDRSIAERDRFIEEQQTCIAAQKAMVEERWEAMQKMSAEIAWRDARIAELEKTLASPLTRLATRIERKLGA